MVVKGQMKTSRGNDVRAGQRQVLRPNGKRARQYDLGVIDR
jgi:hypothetical protein